MKNLVHDQSTQRHRNHSTLKWGALAAGAALFAFGCTDSNQGATASDTSDQSVASANQTSSTSSAQRSGTAGATGSVQDSSTVGTAGSTQSTAAQRSGTASTASTPPSSGTQVSGSVNTASSKQPSSTQASGQTSQEQLEPTGRSPNTDQQAQQLEQRIRMELRNADDIQLQDQQIEQIRISIDQNRVTLSGTVPTQQVASSIEQHVRQIEGVQNVQNQLRPVQ